MTAGRCTTRRARTSTVACSDPLAPSLFIVAGLHLLIYNDDNMKYLYFFKATSHVQVGHVYEHVYSMRLNEYLQDQGLFAYLDYDFEAKTFYNGMIVFSVKAYSSSAETALPTLLDLDAPIETDEVNAALLQIFAEKRADIGLSLEAEIAKELEMLSGRSWQRVDTLEEIIEAVATAKKPILELAPRHQEHFKELRQIISINLDGSSAASADELLVFTLLSHVISENLKDLIADSVYCFTEEDSFRVEGQYAYDENVYIIDDRQAVGLTTEIEEAEKFIRKMQSDDFIGKFKRYLSNVSVEPYQGPSLEMILEKTNLLAGPTTWRRLADEQLIIQTLNQMTLTFTLGDTKSTLKFNDVVSF